jgi:hypothetical protein
VPHIPLSQLVFLCVVAAAFLIFMATLIYVSVWAMVAETSTPEIAREVTPAHRVTGAGNPPST